MLMCGGADAAFGRSFTPASLGAKLWLWQDPNQGVTTAGTSVTSIVERGPDALTGTGANAPPHVIADANFNNKASIQFTAASSQSVSYNATLGARFGGLNTGCRGSMLYRPGAAAALTIWSVGNGGAAAQEWRMRHNATNVLSFVRTGSDGVSTDTDIGATALTLDTLYLVSWYYTGTNLYLFINGTVDLNNVAHSTTTLGTLNAFSFGKRNNSGGANAFTGYLGEAVIMDATTTLAEHRQVNDYLAARYGLTIASQSA